MCHDIYLRLFLHCLIHSICLPAGSVPPSPGMVLPPSTALQPQEGTAAADSAGHALQKQIQAETLLGKEGRGLQFALYSELKAGMQWHYVLLCMSCNAHGQPCKVHMLAKAFLSLQGFCQNLCHYSNANCQNPSKPVMRWRARSIIAWKMTATDQKEGTGMINQSSHKKALKERTIVCKIQKRWSQVQEGFWKSSICRLSAQRLCQAQLGQERRQRCRMAGRRGSVRKKSLSMETALADFLSLMILQSRYLYPELQNIMHLTKNWIVCYNLVLTGTSMLFHSSFHFLLLLVSECLGNLW